MRAVLLHPQFVEQRRRVLRDAMDLTIEDVNTVFRDFDAEVGVLDLSRQFGNFAA